MKTPSISALLAVCGLALQHGSAHAQDNEAPKPAAETVKPAEPREENSSRPRPQRPDGDRSERERGGPDRRGPQPEMKPASFIGVFTHPLSEEVRAHTGLAPGFGLIVEEVMPDSPAATAELKQHDVLVLLGDQKLVNQDQLSALVRAEKKDAEITFTIKRAGADQKVNVKVGEKMMPVTSEREMPRIGFAPWDNMFSGRDGERLGREMREQAERFRDGMKQFQEQFQDWSRGPKDRPAPQFDRDGDRRDGDRRPGNPQHRPQGRPVAESESRSSSSTSSNVQRNIVRRDDSGEYSLTENNGAKVFTVKPASGDEQSFIVNTEEQRKAIPDNLRDKLHELENVDGKMKPPATPPAPEAPKPGI